jgi:hypothetical protein
MHQILLFQTVGSERLKTMARLSRTNTPNIPQQVIKRGNNRHAYFFCKQGYAVYLD